MREAIERVTTQADVSNSVQACRATVYIDSAQQQEPDSIAGVFIRFKIDLQQGDAEAAIQQLQRLKALDGFKPEFVRVCHLFNSG